MTEFFISRPVLATVINMLIVIVGVLSYRNLGVSEYPNVSIPTVTVTAPYPNASAEIVESDVTPLLEEQLAGVEGLENIQSSSTTGLARVTLTFRPNTSMDRALAQVRDRVGRARAFWPKDAKEPVIEQQGSQSQPIIWLSVTSSQHKFAELTHFARLYIKNQLQTIPGVSSVLIEGPPFMMMISLNRLQMFAHGVSASDVMAALSNSRASFPAGRFQGETPVTLKFPLEDPEDFENVVIKKTGHSLVMLRDIASVSLGFDEHNIARINGKGAVFLGVIKASDGNPLLISDSLKKLLPGLKQTLPTGVDLRLEHDGANFIRASLNSIEQSILEAGALVLLIILLFLRNLRSTFIPLITIPISLIGTLAFISAFGFSINTISLLAMVLAVGLVVDDAIVMLENIHHHVEKGLSPLEAAKKGSREIAFAIIAMTLTLASVYAPIAFIGGIIGQLFIEFALTLAAAVVVSGFVALTLSPMMCSRLLRKQQKEMFPIVDVWIAALNRNYRKLLSRILGFQLSVMVFASAVIVAGVAIFMAIPSELAPKEDRGFIGATIEPLPGKPITALLPYADKVEEVFRRRQEVSRLLTFTEGEALVVVAPLKDWSERKKHSAVIIEEVREQLKAIPSINVYGWNWDTGLPGIELSDRGAALAVIVRTTGTYKELNTTLDLLQKSCEKESALSEIWHDIHLDYPGLRAKIDEKKMALLEIAPQEVAKAIETSFDKSATLEFLKDGVRYNVSLSAESFPNDLSEVYVNNAKGTPIPLSTVVDLEAVALPAELQHTRQLRSANFGAQLQKGQSLSQGIRYLEAKMKEELPESFSYELTGTAQKQQESAQVMLLLFAMALVFIYCVMAIQFESFVDPLIILLTVPLASCGALFFIWMLGQSLNIFSQIGLITLIGLITKHGILIVDFANRRLETGLTAFEAVLEAASQRLRPVLMTTGAMLFGSVPLMMASGAGSEARRAIGSVLVGGLLFGTLLTLFVVPAVYLFVKSRRRTIISPNALLVGAILLLAPVANGQNDEPFLAAPAQFLALESSQTPGFYTLDDAIARAIAKNESYLAALEQLEAQKGLSRLALAQILPKLEAKGLLLQQSDLIGPVEKTYSLSPRGGLHLDLPIFQASGFLASLNSSNWVKFQEAKVNRAKQNLILDVTRSYFALVYAQTSVEIAQSQLERAQAKEKSFKRQFEADHVALLDLQREQILVKKGEAQLQNAETAKQTALGTLGLLIGETASFAIAAPPKILANEEEAFEKLIYRARLQREDLKAQAFAASAAKGDYNAQWLGFLPSLNLQADLAGPFDGSSMNQIKLQSTIFLQLTLPIFDGGARYGSLRTARAKSREENFKLALVERGLSLEINGALADIGRKKKLIENAEAVLDLTKSVYKSAENLFSVGRTTGLDLITAQSDLYRAEYDVIEKRLDLDQARLTFAFVLGDDIRTIMN